MISRATAWVLTAVGAIGVAAVLYLVPGLAVPADMDVPGRLLSLEGNVFLAHAGGRAPATATTDDVLRAGDVIETQPRSRAKMLLADDTIVTVGESSRFGLLDARDGDRGARTLA